MRFWLHFLTVVLVILKVTGTVTFGWLLVFTPSLVALAITAFFLALVLLAAVYATVG